MTQGSMPEPGTLISTRDVADMLGITSTTVIRLVENGDIPAYKIGGVWRFRREDIKAYFESSRYQPGQKIDADKEDK